MTRPTPAAEHFLRSLDLATHVTLPFDYWLLADMLPLPLIEAAAQLPFEPPAAPVFDGRRESNNSTRAHFTPRNQRRFAACRDIVAAFRSVQVMAAIERVTGTDLRQGQLRIEYCQDVDGFWLEPHLDIGVKLFTMLIYLSPEPELRDAGTDIYDDGPEHRLVASAPYERNAGLVFIPSQKSWHGFTPRPIRGLRKSLIVNYVSPGWNSVGELA